MKSIQQHITERLQLNKNRIKHYEYFPETTKELKDMSDDSKKMSINELREKLNVINHNISYVEEKSYILLKEKLVLKNGYCRYL